MGARRHGVFVPARTDRFAVGMRAGEELIFPQSTSTKLTSQTCLALHYHTVKAASTHTQVLFVSGTGFQTVFSIDQGTKKLRFQLSCTSAPWASSRNGLTEIPVNSWNHYAATSDNSITGANKHIYLGIGGMELVLDDGTSSNGGGTPGDSDGVFCISGYGGPGLGGRIYGDLAYLARWNRELTFAELLNAQAFGPGAVPNGLVFYWSCGKDRGIFRNVPSAYSAANSSRGRFFPPVGGQIKEWSRSTHFYTERPKRRAKLFVPARTDLFSSGVRTGSRLMFPAHPQNTLAAQTMMCLFNVKVESATNHVTQFIAAVATDAISSGTSLQRASSANSNWLKASFHRASTSTSVTGNIPIPNNGWHHAAATWEPDVSRALYVGLYRTPFMLNVSGGGEGTGTAGEPTDSPFAVGGSAVNGSNSGNVKGSIAYAARWNRVLSLTELLLAQAWGPGAVPEGLVFYWSCGKDRGPLKLVPTTLKTASIGRGEIFPNAGGRIYEWRDHLHTSRPTSGAVAVTYQYLRPASDIATNGWLPSTGSDLYAMLDETVASDADYIYSPVNPTTQQFEVKLSPGGKPPLGSTMLVTMRFRAMELDTTFDIDVVENTTVKDSWTEAVTVAAGVVERQHTVASAIVDGMTDFTNIRVRGVARAP